MALTATATQGLQLHRYTTENEVLWVPGDPGDTFTRGDAVTAAIGEGILDPAATTETTVGTVLETVVCSAATQAFPKPADFDPVAKTAADLCLVPIRPAVPSGTPVYKVTFAGHDDETVVSYTASTRAVEATTGAAADDYPNGGLIYVYEGPGIGEVNVCEDYDHTGGAAELLTICHRPFAATLTTASKYILLAGEAAGSRGIGFFTRIDLADEDNLTVADGANDGKYVVYMSWEEMSTALKNLTLHVVPASAFFT